MRSLDCALLAAGIGSAGGEKIGYRGVEFGPKTALGDGPSANSLHADNSGGRKSTPTPELTTAGVASVPHPGTEPCAQTG